MERGKPEQGEGGGEDASFSAGSTIRYMMAFTTGIVPFKFYQARPNDAGQTVAEFASKRNLPVERVEMENNSKEPIKEGDMLILHS